MHPQASNVLFTNGRIDPWSVLSIREPVGHVDAVLYDAGHCAPMTKATAQDPVSLKAARLHVATFIEKILQ